MNWLNIETTTLDSEEFVGSDPINRATWLCLFRYCAGQENGGVILACKPWADRKWQQLARVTQSEVLADSTLWRWIGDDLHLWSYPCDKEAEVKQRRDRARINGQRGGRPPLVPPSESKGTDVGTQNKPTSVNSAKAEGEGEGEGEGEENKSAPPPGDTPELPLKESFPANLDTEAFREAWKDWLAYRREGRLTKYKPRTVAAQLKELSEWGESESIKSIRDSIRQQYQGLFQPKAGIGQQTLKSGGTSTYELEAKAHGYTL